MKKEKTPLEWKRESQAFDTVAEDYDAYRPGYPKEMIDCLIQLTGLSPTGRILEIGAGTGKATLAFAERGHPLLCIEPGENLAAVAVRNLRPYPAVRFEISRFEEWQESPGSFDLVISAQAFHWVPKDVGFAKAARSLKAGGSLALFWNMYPGMEGPFRTGLDEIYQEIAPEIASPETTMDETIRSRTAEIVASGYFGPVTVRRFPWSLRYTSQAYQGLLNTYSDHIGLPIERRRSLFHAVGELIDAHGGSFVRPYVAVLFVAKKPGPMR